MTGFIIFIACLIAFWAGAIFIAILFMLAAKIIRWLAEMLNLDDW